MTINTPITSAKNIEIEGIEGYCKNKCSIRYDYKVNDQICVQKTSSNITINLKPLEQTAPSITFDGTGYNPTSVSIYAPSLHTYNRQRADAEICITHRKIDGTPGNFYIFIPLLKEYNSKLPKSSGDEKNCNEMLTDILDNISNVACSDETWVKIDFTMNSFLPNKPYFYYKSNNNDIIVFHTNEHNLIGVNEYNKLVKSRIRLNRDRNIPLFYSGEQTGQKISNDIYIEVRQESKGSPVDEDDSEDTVEGFSVFNNEEFCVKSSVENSISILLLMSIFYVGFKVITTKN